MESRKKTWLGAGVLVLAGLFIYWPALSGGWVWDDDLEITRNPVLADPGGWWKIWLRPEGPDYYPLKTTLQWCEWHLWGNQVIGYHLVSLGFHLLGAFLLWRVLAKLDVGGSFLAGLLFAIHPLCVESVAWISELKNVMSLPLLLLAMGAWVDWEGRADPPGPPGSPVGPAGPAAPPYLGGRPNELLHRRPEGWSPRYLRALLWFLAALLCKSSVVMFPVVILLYAWWRRGRVSGRDVRASLPFFAISLALGAVTAWFQSQRAIAGMELHLGGPLWRLGSAALAAAFYFCKCLLPAGLMPIYPDWGGRPIWFQPAICWLLILAGLVFLWRRREGYGRDALFGAGFFLINLLPVLGFIPMAYLRISRVADHLCYVPLVGIIGLGLAALNAGRERLRRVERVDPNALLDGAPGQRVGVNALHLRAAAIALVCVGLVFESRRYAQIFSDPMTFWSHAAERNPGSWLAQNNLGTELDSRGRPAEAAAHFQAALRAKPDYAEAESNWGNALLQSGRVPEAMAHFERAVRLKPDYAEAYCDWGNAFVQSGRFSEAIGCFEKAMRLKPDYAEAYSNRGLVFSSQGRQAAAMADFETALRLRPDLAEAELDLGLALARAGRRPEAIVHYRKALQLRPGFREAHNNLGNALYLSGRPKEAVAEYEAALRIDPHYVDAQNNLGIARRALAPSHDHP